MNYIGELGIILIILIIAIIGVPLLLGAIIALIIGASGLTYIGFTLFVACVIWIILGGAYWII